MAELRRVLIVAPRFAPTAAPDAERARRLIPFLNEYGWEGEVLTARPELSHAPEDRWLVGDVPAGVPVHAADGLDRRWARAPGLGSVGVRTYLPMRRLGDRLLQSRHYDLVYFASTSTESFAFGPRWKRRFGVPFAVDFQDPWVNNYYRENPQVRPPGGRLKHGVVDALHRRLEPRVLRECAGITSVSPEYPRDLECRYPRLAPIRALVEPFPVPERDIERLGSAPIDHGLFDPNDGLRHWLYMGAVVPGMMPAIRAVLLAVAQGSPQLREELRIHFIGTSYAPDGVALPAVESAARDLGLDGVVRERPTRVPYSQALAAMRDASVLLAFGSDDRGYVASKVLLMLALRRPFLGLFHRESATAKLLEQLLPMGIIPFPDHPDVPDLATQVSRLMSRPDVPGGEVAPELIEPFTSRASAKRVCAFFDACILDD